MNRFDDYPYAPFRAALCTVLGRLGLILLAVVVGSMLGGLTATKSLAGLWLGLVGLPGLSLSSIFFGVGILVLPLLLIYAIASVRCEWPLRLTLLCILLMWWNVHKTVRWTVYDSPRAKQEKKLEADMQKIAEDVNEEIRKKANKSREAPKPAPTDGQ